MMTSANIVTGAQAINVDNWMDDPNVIQITYPKSFILDAIKNTKMSKVPAVWRVKEQQAWDGTITAVNEGATKIMTQAAFAYTQYTRKKYAGYMELTEEAEIDFEFLVRDIITMFEQQVLRAWQAGVLADLITFASAYTTTSMDGTLIAPSVYNVIMAGISWMGSPPSGNEFQPDVVIMNPADLWLAKSAQDKNGNQQLSMFSPSTDFAGLTLLTSNYITAGKILLLNSAAVEEIHGDYIIRKGVTGTQFIENEFTIVGEIFSILRTPTISELLEALPQVRQ